MCACWAHTGTAHLGPVTVYLAVGVHRALKLDLAGQRALVDVAPDRVGAKRFLVVVTFELVPVGQGAFQLVLVPAHHAGVAR